MTVAVKPENIDRFMALSAQHAVESTVIGEYTDSGKLHILYNGKTCAYVNMNLLKSGFPEWKFDAQWFPPEQRGLYEPVIAEPENFNPLLLAMLARPNICSKEWITRQYDHEVQGGSVIKPLVGKEHDVYSDATVIRPVLSSSRGIVFSQAILPMYSAIDAYHMTTCTIDEAVRRMVAVGGSPDHIGGVDNFCWPNIAYDPDKNPDGRFKAAQLVRSCRALYNMCMAYGIPLLSGKDSMYVDGHLPGKFGETHKVSALETMQFSACGVTEDVEKCVTMDVKCAGDLVYILGETRNELGGSEYYDLFDYIGKNVPQVLAETFIPVYNALFSAIRQGLAASAHGIYRGGLGVHLAMIAMGGNLGLDIDLSRVPADNVHRNDTLLFSESAGRFLVTVAPQFKDAFEKLFANIPCACIGKVTSLPALNIIGVKSNPLISAAITDLKTAWKKPFGALL
jgi:phosphoribosylformylglycinamidine synthase